MTDITWTNCVVKLGDLKPWADNPRTSTKAQAKRILASFDRFGQVAPIAIDPGNNVLDGHQRLSALLTVHGAGYEVEARRSSRPLSDDERRGLVLALANATGSWNWDSLSNWNTETLTEWGFDKDTLKGWKSDVTALGEFLKSEAPAVDAEPQTDRASELLEKWGVQPGDLWLIGDHRLICGDCTDAATVARVMDGEKAKLVFSDPPYNVAYAGRGQHTNVEIENDDMPEDEFIEWLIGICKVYDANMENGASIYLCHGDTGRKALPFIECFAALDWTRSSTIIWAKNAASMGWQDYRSQHECVSYGWKSGAKHYFIDDRSQTTVWEISRDSQNSYIHPTTKPVELPERAIKNSSIDGEIVIDFFLGSGTTLVACENLRRRCRAIEISPAYVSVALERMATAFPALDIRRVE